MLILQRIKNIFSNHKSAWSKFAAKTGGELRTNEFNQKFVEINFNEKKIILKSDKFKTGRNKITFTQFLTDSNTTNFKFYIMTRTFFNRFFGGESLQEVKTGNELFDKDYICFTNDSNNFIKIFSEIYLDNKILNLKLYNDVSIIHDNNNLTLSVPPLIKDSKFLEELYSIFKYVLKITYT